MKTFEDLEVRRQELLKAQSERPIARFAPRRVGNAFFLD